MSMSHELSKLLHEADMLQGHKYGQVSNIIANASPDLRRRLAEAIYPEGAPPKFTYGHCENKKQKGGCQEHNLHCGYPDCDRRPA